MRTIKTHRSGNQDINELITNNGDEGWYLYNIRDKRFENYGITKCLTCGLRNCICGLRFLIFIGKKNPLNDKDTSFTTKKTKKCPRYGRELYISDASMFENVGYILNKICELYFIVIKWSNYNTTN